MNRAWPLLPMLGATALACAAEPGNEDDGTPPRERPRAPFDAEVCATRPVATSLQPIPERASAVHVVGARCDKQPGTVLLANASDAPVHSG